MIKYDVIEKNTVKKCVMLYKQVVKAGLQGVGSWYQDANKAINNIAELTGVDPVSAAGIVSALSPRNKWERNLIDALNLIQAYKQGLSVDAVKVCTFNSNKAKAWGILTGELSPVPCPNKSPKTNAFIRNILGDNMPVTVDVWHTRAMIGKDSPGSLRMYRAIESGTQKAAKRLGIPPSHLQAVIWVYCRDYLGADETKKVGLK